MNDTHSQSLEQLQKKLADTLDHSVMQLEPTEVDQLVQARRQALLAKISSPAQSKQQLLIWPSIAAAFLLAVVAPLLFRDANIRGDILDDPQLELLSYYDVDPEMLEVMDILLAMGELAEDEPDAI